MRYNRKNAVNYARGHALCTSLYESGRDADATAFVSRCIAAGFGLDFECRDPDLLCDTLQNSLSAHECGISELQAGDVVQVRSRDSLPYKSLIVTEKTNEDILVAAHSYISLDRQLSSYRVCDMRCIRIGLC